MGLCILTAVAAAIQIMAEASQQRAVQGEEDREGPVDFAQFSSLSAQENEIGIKASSYRDEN